MARKESPHDEFNPSPIHPSLNLYFQCKNMNALPKAGGILDQDPEVLEDFAIIESILEGERKREETRPKSAKDFLGGKRLPD